MWRRDLTLLFLFGVLFAALFILHERQVEMQRRAALERHARVLAPGLWDFDRKSPVAYLAIAAELEHYEEAAVHDQDGKLFVSVTGPPLSRLDRACLAAGLAGRVKMSAPVLQGAQPIGELRVRVLDLTVYTHAYVLLLLLCLYLALVFFLHTLDGKRSLEVRVRERTAEIAAANRALSDNEKQLRIFQESVANSSDAVVIYSPEGQPGFQNKAFDELFGAIGAQPPGTVYVEPAVGEEVFRTIMAGGSWSGEVKMHARDRRVLNVLLRAYANKDKDGRITALVGIHTDVTAQRKLEENLRQAAKMDAVGRLAGGVAHDFNNMLGAILGYTELAMEACRPDAPLHANLKQIEQAALRSADLTRQLLAFARKQTVAPRIQDLNVTVEGMLKLLRRLIGEDIELVWKPCGEPATIRMDTTQIDQILANLCVNARDAISGGGTIIIETARVTLESGVPGYDAIVGPGDYVRLCVSDTGCGMDAATVSHLFEPFFTTKKTGEGTGLGLATVYGVVKQNGGSITVYSEPGRGTTFKIYLPRHGAQEPDTSAAAPAAPPLQRQVTVLLVEDEPMMLEMTTCILRKLGYQVVVAEGPEQALALAKERSEGLDLLLTDVVMPGMNGRELADRVASLHPECKRLFMSGYTANVIAHHGVLDEGVCFIQKPFSAKALDTKIREILGPR